MRWANFCNCSAAARSAWDPSRRTFGHDLIVDVGDDATQVLFDAQRGIAHLPLPTLGLVVGHGDTSPHSSMGRRKSAGQCRSGAIGRTVPDW